MDSYLDFGSDSDGENSPDEFGNQGMEIDSDEEEKNQNDQIFKMLMEKTDTASSKSRKEHAIDDFEAEMEAELDKRALKVETEGGMKHQQSLSRSSSSSSLTKLALSAPSREESQASAGPSSSKRPKKSMLKDPNPKQSQSTPKKKMVKFSDVQSSDSTSTTVEATGSTSEPIPIPTKEGIEPIGSSNLLESKKRYEDIYFDSDESEGEDDATRKTRSDKRTFLSNDELFYDPKSDTRDQAWVDKQRRKYYVDNQLNSTNSNSNSTKSGVASHDDLLGTKPKPPPPLPPGLTPLPTSDAVLNCPACFTVLCLDCQRHEIYNNQYRAMFVMNCIVNSDEVIYAPLKQDRKSRARAARGGGTKPHQQLIPAEPSDNIKDRFNTVKCKVCSTQIGVYDHDEVYHFINVLASHS